jgi:predicted CxxxxCH...CXXCH cytochrome family protein
MNVNGIARKPFRPLGPVSLPILAALFAFGCSSGPATSGLSLVDAQGDHPANFLSAHPAFAVADVEQCRLCHGDALAGGIANTSCFTAECHHGTVPGWAAPAVHGAEAKKAPGSSGFGSCRICHGFDFTGGGAKVSCVNDPACHGAGVQAPHPSRWLPGRERVHTDTHPENAPVCALCHFDEPDAGNHPPAPPPPGSDPGCFNSTLCHGPEVAPHAVRPFADHPSRAQSEFSTFCNGCHNIDPPRLLSTAPACTECHVGGNPLQVTNCATCHGNPPDGQAPVGNVFPNVEGAHPEHDALEEVAGACGTCHDGGGAGAGLAHLYNDAVDVAFQDLVFQAKTGGSLLFNPADNTCSNVSCHGGQTTPNWRTGTIDVNTNAGCLQCHRAREVSDQFNSFFSGEHEEHLEEGIACRDCHDMNRAAPGAANHFRFLSTPQMEGPASDTFQSLPAPDTIVYDPGANTCTGTCHGKEHNPRRWF